MLHELKILPENFEDITNGRKDFEIRKNDRDYMEGDTLALNEYKRGKYTGRFHLAKIKKVYDYPDYLKNGYVILQLTNFGNFSVGAIFNNINRLNEEAGNND